MTKMPHLNTKNISYLVWMLWRMAWMTEAEDSGCGNEKQLTSQSGIVTSHPGYGLNLAPSAFCEWIISPPSDKYVSLTIQDMGNISCHTQLFIYTHTEGSTYPGWNLCDSDEHRDLYPLDGVPYHLASRRGEWLRIWYKGNQQADRTSGFKMKYEMKEPGCHGHSTMSQNGGLVTSHPGAGIWAVEAGSECSWTISAPTGQYVSIHANSIWLNCHGNWQTLGIYDGAEPLSENIIAMVTCTDNLSEMASIGRHMFLQYTDRWASNGLGFNISYSFHSSRQSGCGGDYLLTPSSGNIYSHNSNISLSKYRSWSRCSWQITALPGVQIRIRFLWFDVPSEYVEEVCSRDMLVLHDGGEHLVGMGHMFCNGKSEPPAIITSTSNVINLRFYSSELSTFYPPGHGFGIHYAYESEDGIEVVSVGESVEYTCIQGYSEAGGDVSRICQEDGTLSGQDIICTPVQCSIERASHSEVQLTDINMDGLHVVSFGEVVTYSCSEGYAQQGGDTRRRCMQNGALSGQQIKCTLVTCSSVPHVKHASPVYMDANDDGRDIVTFGEQIIYSCHHGYMQKGGTSVRLCQADSTFSGIDLICAPRECSELPSIDHVTVEFTDENHDGITKISLGEKLLYSCQQGYFQTAGDRTRHCLEGGSLNGTLISCKPQTCQPITNISNTKVTLEDRNNDGIERFSYGEALQYECLTGYVATSGDDVRMCEADGALSGEDLSCKPNMCRTLPNIPHASGVSNDTNKDGATVITFTEVVSYTCDPGYAPAGGDTERTCLHNGSLDGTDMECRKIVCGSPQGYLNSVMGQPSDGSFFMSRVNYTCSPGYVMRSRLDPVTKVCQASREWTGPDIICEFADDEPSRHSSNMRKLIVTGAVVAVALLVVFIACVIAVSSAVVRKRRDTITRNSKPIRIKQQKLHTWNYVKPHAAGQSQNIYHLPKQVEPGPQRSISSGFSLKAPSTASYMSGPMCVFSPGHGRYGVENPTYNWYSYWTRGLKKEELNLSLTEDTFKPIPRPLVKRDTTQT